MARETGSAPEREPEREQPGNDRPGNDGPGNASSGNQLGNQLIGWKAIAAALAVSVRTAQNWHKREGMPIQFHPHRQRSTPAASLSALRQWRQARNPARIISGNLVSGNLASVSGNSASGNSAPRWRHAVAAVCLLAAAAAVPLWCRWRSAAVLRAVVPQAGVLRTKPDLQIAKPAAVDCAPAGGALVCTAANVYVMRDVGRYRYQLRFPNGLEVWTTFCPDYEPMFSAGQTLTILKYEDRGACWSVANTHPAYLILRDDHGKPVRH